MSLETLTEKIREKVGDDAGLGASIKFAFKEGGCILLDGSVTPNTVSNDDGDAQCTVIVAQADFAQMIEGNLDPTVAFMSGKLKVEGDMSVAMKLGNLLK
jgi:putative sterol carrier protein